MEIFTIAFNPNLISGFIFNQKIYNESSADCVDFFLRNKRNRSPRIPFVMTHKKVLDRTVVWRIINYWHRCSSNMH